MQSTCYFLTVSHFKLHVISHMFVYVRHVEVRTNAPRGYICTIKVSEDVPQGSVGFSLVQVSYCP